MDIPAQAVTLYESRRVRLACDPQELVCYQQLKAPDELQDPEYAIFIWHGAVLLAACAAMLRRENLLLMHCAMLEKDGNALLLCGESGVGKSTSSRRWREAGYAAAADDMVLLEFDNDGIYAHRLPTWSACRESGLAGKSYPFAPPLKLKQILALGRGDEEKIAPLPAEYFFAQIYHCAYFHYAPLFPALPGALRELAAGQLQKLAGYLREISPPRALFAALDGDLNRTLEDVL
jgi:hypothetical protein